MVGVSKSTVSNWFSRETWSQNISETNLKRASKSNSKRISLLNTSRGNQHKKMYAEAERSAVTEFKHYKNNPLFIAGVMIYATSGDKTSNGILRLTSARKDVHRVFIAFVLEYLGVPREKVRFWLMLTPDMEPEKSSRAWAKTIQIPLPQFHKYQVSPNTPAKQTLRDGVGNTIIGGTVLKKKLMKWIELMSKEL